jgi:hypothetical protein
MNSENDNNSPAQQRQTQREIRELLSNVVDQPVMIRRLP